MEDEEFHVGQEESIKVIVRLRPVLRHELDRGVSSSVIALSPPDGKSLIVNGLEARHKLQVKFDGVFGEESTQEDVYKMIKECSKAVVEGFNTTVFAYGQTGTGKTHTMFGPPGHIQSLSFGGKVNNLSGIIPRAVIDIFDRLGRLGTENSSTVYCSFVQVYNEQLFDMLRDGNRLKPLELHEGRDGVYVQGLSEYSVNGFGDCLELLRLGEENRMVRETHMNVTSSRSHSIFTVFIERQEKRGDGEVCVKSKFNLVDLAGSEKWDLNQEMVNDRVSEMTNINLSLYTLGRCIAALASKSASAQKHIPYRDSRLTRLLQDSLGGNAKTRVIATLSPASDCVDESISTLRFADRAKQVMVFLRKNEDLSVDPKVVEKLQREIYRLRTIVKQLSEAGAAPTVNLPRINDLEPSPVASPRLNVDTDEMARPKHDKKSPRGTLTSRLPAIPSPGSPIHSEEMAMLKATNESLFQSLEQVLAVTNQFFAFEIEEEDLKQAVESAASPGVKAMQNLRKFLQKSNLPISSSKNRKTTTCAKASPVRKLTVERSPPGRKTMPVSGLSPLIPVPLETKWTQNSRNNSAGSALGSSSRDVQGSQTSVRVVSEETPVSDGARRVTSKFRVRGKSGDTAEVDEKSKAEAQLAAELAKAKARMIKHQKLQAWLKAKEDKELALLDEEEAAERESFELEARREKHRINKAKKNKQKLKSYYKSLEEDEEFIGASSFETQRLNSSKGARPVGGSECDDEDAENSEEDN